MSRCSPRSNLGALSTNWPAKLGHLRPRSANYGPSWAGFGLARASIRRTWPKFGEFRTNVDQIWPEVAEVWPGDAWKSARKRSGEQSSREGVISEGIAGISSRAPGAPHLRPSRGTMPMRPSFVHNSGRIPPNFTRSGAQSGQIWPTPGHNWPKFSNKLMGCVRPLRGRFQAISESMARKRPDVVCVRPHWGRT